MTDLGFAPEEFGEFKRDLQDGLLRQRIQSLVVDGVQVADSELEDRYRADHEQVSLAFVRTAAANLAKDVTLSDDDLRAIYRYLKSIPPVKNDVGPAFVAVKKK